MRRVLRGNAVRWPRVAALLTAAWLTIVSSGAAAQTIQQPELDPSPAGTPSLDPAETVASDASRKTGAPVTPIFAPIPFRNSQLGWGLVLMAGAIHRFDPDTTIKPSTGAVTGFYSENGSWGLMALEMARLARDTWRLRGLYSHFEVRYDFYGVGEDAGEAGISVPLEQTMDFSVGSALHRWAPNFYAGGAILWMRSTVDLRAERPPEIPPIQSDIDRTQLVAPGAQAEFDTRDDDYWPTAGSVASLKGWFFLDGMGGEREFQRYIAAWSWYTKLREERLVLATNVNAASAFGDVPFYMLPAVGVGKYGLRGYTQGRYRDRVMITAQAEARFHTSGRLGATVFAGFGQVAPEFSELTNAVVLPAGGVGLRYQLTRRFPMHMRLDLAWGKDEPLLYFSVAEAF